MESDNTMFKTLMLLAAGGAAYVLYAGNTKQFCLWKTSKKTGRSCVHTCSRKRLDLVGDMRDVTDKKNFDFDIRPTTPFQVEHCD